MPPKKGTIKAVSKKSTKKDAPVKEKKVKDSDAPKRPLSGYQLFCAEMRPQLKGEGVEHKQMFTELGARWKELSEEDKQPYMDEAAEVKEAYKAQHG